MQSDLRYCNPPLDSHLNLHHSICWSRPLTFVHICKFGLNMAITLAFSTLNTFLVRKIKRFNFFFTFRCFRTSDPWFGLLACLFLSICEKYLWVMQACLLHHHHETPHFSLFLGWFENNGLFFLSFVLSSFQRHGETPSTPPLSLCQSSCFLQWWWSWVEIYQVMI